jgi:large subunit ribosomal protein L19
MSQEILSHVEKSSITKQVPVLRAGNSVRVHQKIKEGGKERVQIFEGLVIRINSGSGVNKTFTVRKIVDGVGVEKIFPFYSPNIKQIDVIKDGKVRRAKLYYMRDRSGKSARLREQTLGDLEMEGEEYVEPVEEPEVEEAPEATPESEAAPAAEEPAAEEAPAEEKAEEPAAE